MFRKIILFIAAVGLAGVAFTIYLWGEDEQTATTRPVRPVPSPITTQPGAGASTGIGIGNIRPGPTPKVSVYDPKTGEATLVFESAEWEPVANRDNEWLLVRPAARLLLPGGQIAYVRANRGQVKVQGGGDELKPKSGQFTGEVEIIIDMTKPEWRLANPDRAARDDHPESLIKIAMEDAHFDIDLAWLRSEGRIRVESQRGSIEGRGLELVWNEVTRQVRTLRIAEGHRAILKGMAMAELSDVTVDNAGSPAAPDKPALANLPAETEGGAAGSAGQPAGPDTPPTAAEGAAPAVSGLPTDAEREQLMLLAPGEPVRHMPKDRIDTYELSFRDQVVARQIRGEQTAGSLKADVIRVLTDFGRQERDAIEYAPATRPAKDRPAATAPAAEGAAHAVSDLPAPVEPDAYVELTWKGPLELAPATPDKAATTAPANASAGPPAAAEGAATEGAAHAVSGLPTSTAERAAHAVSGPPTAAAPPGKKRTHLIADGSPVIIEDARTGRAVCSQLEYHVESKRLWLRGSPDTPVTLTAGTVGTITVQNTLHVDQAAGFARIDGPGRMTRSKPPATRPAATDEGAAHAVSGLPTVAAPDATAPATAPGAASEGAAHAVSGLPADADEPAGWTETGLIGDTSQIELAWQTGGRIDFAAAQHEHRDPATGQTATRRQIYIAEADFTGQVQVGLPDQEFHAGHVAVTFLPPPPPSDRNPRRPADGPDAAEASADPSLLTGAGFDKAIARLIVAEQDVRMVQRTQQRGTTQRGFQTIEEVTCGRLEVDLTVDDVGRNVPEEVRAFDRVVARQVVQPHVGPVPAGPPLVRDIRAEQSMTLTMASQPKPVTAAERERFEAYARQRGLTPDSPAWQAFEQRLRNRREIVLRRLTARGAVRARDEKQELRKLAGDLLDCEFSTEGQIDRGLVVGTDTLPAEVDHGTFYMQGQQLSLDMAEQSFTVPGAGKLRFHSRQDIDGRPTADAIPIEVAWRDRMWLRGNDNTGTFAGAVRVHSENNLLEARELRLRFAELDEPAEPTETDRTRGLIQAIREQFGGKPADRPAVAAGFRKKLIRVDAAGDAVIVSSSYGRDDVRRPTILSSLVREVVPDALQTRPSDTQPQEAADQRLLSRIRLGGPQMRMDLIEQQLLIDGAGNLLVEDYRLPEPGRTESAGGLTGLGTAALPSMNSMGPSQTLFTWANSMTFLNKSGVAVFDRDVIMNHRAGADMVLAGELEKALKLDPKTRQQLTRRTANLACNNLVVEFDRLDDGDRAARETTPISTATRLRGFRANGDVRLVNVESDKQRSASAAVIRYDGNAGIAEILGTSLQPALIQEIDRATARFTGNWRGDSLTWNLDTGQIFTRGSSILGTR